MNHRYDDAGWLVGSSQARPLTACFTFFAREADVRLIASRIRASVESFGIQLTMTPEKSMSGATRPLEDHAHCELLRAGHAAQNYELWLAPADRRRELVTQGAALARQHGGAGMDALILRATSVLQFEASELGEADPSAWALSFAISSAFLAAVLPPSGGPVVGPRSARERAEQAFRQTAK